LSGFSPVSPVPSIVTFSSGVYIGRHIGCYVGGLYELCQKCVTHVCKRSTVISLLKDLFDTLTIDQIIPSFNNAILIAEVALDEMEK